MHSAYLFELEIRVLHLKAAQSLIIEGSKSNQYVEKQLYLSLFRHKNEGPINYLQSATTDKNQTLFETEANERPYYN